MTTGLLQVVTWSIVRRRGAGRPARLVRLTRSAKMAACDRQLCASPVSSPGSPTSLGDEGAVDRGAQPAQRRRLRVPRVGAVGGGVYRPLYLALFARWDPGMIVRRHGHRSPHTLTVLEGSVACDDLVCGPGTHIELPLGSSFEPFVGRARRRAPLRGDARRPALVERRAGGHGRGAGRPRGGAAARPARGAPGRASGTSGRSSPVRCRRPTGLRPRSGSDRRSARPAGRSACAASSGCFSSRCARAYEHSGTIVRPSAAARSRAARTSTAAQAAGRRAPRVHRCARGRGRSPSRR